ncbi:MAG: 1-deoxy-D-xylulose-5-phosphate reductoisomerase, partial [Proteobacteria bacterium]|nr:1-deoxy-D-xylulose-5-phosphate reductoisomerase [Pseudomonadota bacterium]
PVDSEHSALFQCLSGQPHQGVDRLILTASGGPFWRMDVEALSSITPEQALDHPRWDMGPRVTVDSATLMNKGLELLEAHHLFDQPLERISILIHPQAVVHSMIRFRDGQILSQMGPADMRLPIAYALSYPDRLPLGLPALDLTRTEPLTFIEPDAERFPCLALARDAAREGGSGPTALNAADEVAVAAFLKGRIGFRDIPAVVARVLEARPAGAPADIEDVLAVDRWARRRSEEEIQKV